MLRKIIGFLVLIGLLILGWGSIRVWGSSTIKKSGEIMIESGAVADRVWEKMVNEDFSSTTLGWRYFSWRLGAAQKIQAGKYHLEAGEHIREVLTRLMAGDTLPDELTITYPEGFTLTQIATRTAAQGIGTTEEFVSVATPARYADQFTFVKQIPADRNLEGYLFPDTYRVGDDDTPEDVVRRLLGTFERRVLNGISEQEITASGHTLDEIIRMASIVEREVQTDDDMAKVAGVLWQRLEDNTGLGADATVRYAVNKWDEPLTVADLAIDSPYNTRRYAGLPPGPISNPGLRAILASLRPEKTDYYYYLSTPDGQTIFSKTLDEHNRNKAQYLQ